jgi:nucleoside-triphosphatase
MDMNATKRWMVTGERGAGKTSLCRLLASQARNKGWDAAGVISPGVFENGVKTGIQVEDIRRGESHPLASLEARGPFDLPVGKWYFDRTTLAWGNQVIANSPPCDLLIVDELGPLELLQGDGWQAALEVLSAGSYRLALVVIRPELQELARGVLDFAATLTIDQTKSLEQWMRMYWPRIETSFGGIIRLTK